MAGGIELNRQKLKELVLYLSEKSAEDEGFGMVKLNKLLYRADFEAFRLLGRPITGETYERQDYGPVARDLPIILDELASDHYVIWQRLPRGPYTRKVPAARESPDMSKFSKAEIQIMDRTLAELREHGGKAASEWSHEESAGWNLVKTGDEIPYRTALISTEPLSKDDLERSSQYVRDRGWVTVHP